MNRIFCKDLPLNQGNGARGGVGILQLTIKKMGDWLYQYNAGTRKQATAIWDPHWTPASSRCPRELGCID